MQTGKEINYLLHNINATTVTCAEDTIDIHVLLLPMLNGSELL